MQGEPTADSKFALRLEAMQLQGWKHRVRRIDPYGIYLRSLKPGRTLEIGCGVGRMLDFLRGSGVGVDHNATAVEICRRRGFEAYTPNQFNETSAAFDTLLFAHIIEHMVEDDAIELLNEYLPYLRHGGRVIIITPQEGAFRGDSTHRWWVDFRAGARLCLTVGLQVVHQRSFPLPRWAAPFYTYNEFVTIARLGS